MKAIGNRKGTLAIWTLAVAVTFTSGTLYGGDYYSSVPFLPTVKIGPDSEGATPAETVYGKEYSHTDWLAVYQGTAPGASSDPNLTNVDDHDAFASPDPLQVVSWDGIPGPFGGNSGSVDAFDYGVSGFNYPEGQIDALANHADFLLPQIVRNEATLLFSVTADIDAASVLPVPGGPPAGIVPKAHVHFEDPSGPDAASPGDIWAPFEAPTAGLGPGPGVNHHTVRDVDALEVWGPEPPSHSRPDGVPTDVKEGYLGGFPGPSTADADRFSLDFDAASGVSVWAYDIAAATVAPYIPHADIVAAIEELFLGPGFKFDDETRRWIDVDGTMVRGLGDPDPAVGGWAVGDELLFTIDPVENGTAVGPDGSSVAAPLIDGGEIMHLVKTAPGGGPGTFAVSFLSHGGHLWDTAFDVRGTFGYYYEDVDALEAVGTLTGDTDISTPEPSSILLLALGALGLTIGSGRRFRR